MKNLLLIVLLGCIARLSFAALPASPDGALTHIDHNPKGEAEGLFHIHYDDAVLVATDVADAGQVTGAAAAPQARLTRLAQTFIVEYQDMLGISSPDQMHLTRVTEDPLGNTHLRFRVTYRQIAVDAMEVLIHFDARDAVTGINGNIVRLSAQVREQVDRHLVGGQPPLAGTAS